MKKNRAFLLTLIVIAVFALLWGCVRNNVRTPDSTSPPVASPQSEAISAPSNAPRNPADISEPAVAGEVIVIFDFEKQSGYASNQFAVWIEDMDGNFINTLYATRFTANGGYKNRPDSIPTWVEKSSLAAMRKEEVDAIAGATPKEGTLSYVWNLTAKDGSAVAPGQYRFFVEGSLRWKNRVLYSGVIEIGDVPASAPAEAQFSYEASDSQPALSEDSPETMMIGAAMAHFDPARKNG